MQLFQQYCEDVFLSILKKKRWKKRVQVAQAFALNDTVQLTENNINH